MKLYYFSYTRFPSEKAHAIYLAKSVEALNTIKDVSAAAVVPRRLGVSKQSAKEYYKLRAPIHTVKLPCLDLQRIPFLRLLFYYLSIGSFAFSSWVYAQVKLPADSVLITNDAVVALLLTFSRHRVVYELHDYPEQKSGLYRRVFNRVSLIHTNNQLKKDRLSAEFAIPRKKIFVQPNGVMLEQFAISDSKAEARTKLHLPLDKKLVMYTGHLFDWKGADTLAAAMATRPEYQTVFVGGTPTDVKAMQQQYQDCPHIQFLGHQPYETIPLYQRAADVLVLPNTAKQDISKYHTSPMKAFEYMASGTPIVASDIPSIREILDDDTAYWSLPDDPERLAATIDRVLDEDTTLVTTAAFKTVQQYQWKNRAIEYLKSL